MFLRLDIDKVQLRRALDMIYLEMNDILLDSPYALHYLRRILIVLLKNKIIHPNYLLKIPPDIIDLSNLTEPLKEILTL